MAAIPLMRDVLIDKIFDLACRDRTVVFISADLGAQALDRFRAELPRQFIHAGIAEQNMVDVAAGLARAGRKVYTYAMSSFMTARCYEQIKVALGAMGLPVTVIAVGVGLGYDDAGPTHYTTEDLACMRALPGIEVLSPADAESTDVIADLTYEKPAFRLLRLERPALPPVYHGRFKAALADGFAELVAGEDVALVASGYMLHRTLKARDALVVEGRNPGIVDLFRIKPFDAPALARTLARYRRIVTVEEQWLPGGFGSAVLEALADTGTALPVRRLGLPDRYFFENGGRNRLLDRVGLGIADIVAAARG